MLDMQYIGLCFWEVFLNSFFYFFLFSVLNPLLVRWWNSWNDSLVVLFFSPTFSVSLFFFWSELLNFMFLPSAKYYIFCYIFLFPRVSFCSMYWFHVSTALRLLWLFQSSLPTPALLLFLWAPFSVCFGLSLEYWLILAFFLYLRVCWICPWWALV